MSRSAVVLRSAKHKDDHHRMTPEQQQRADDLFGELLECSADARAEALAREPDAEVRAEVGSLLRYARPEGCAETDGEP